MTLNTENALIHQKDTLIKLVNDGDYDKAIMLLDFVKEMWLAMGYDYKTREIRERITNAISEHLWHDNPHWKVKVKLQEMLKKVA
jgi:hypothetical protein